MIRTGLLLAAGASRRFGADEKLLADLNNRPLISYAAEAMRKTPLEHRFAIISNPALRPFLSGFKLIEIAQGTQSDSLIAGLNAVGEPDRLLITLADMPVVTSALLSKVVVHTGDDSPAACRDDGPPMPPACFPGTWLARLAGATGDRGAGQFIRDLPSQALITASGLLHDVDDSADLEQLEAQLRKSGPKKPFSGL